jgi:hypothetical protein
MADFDPKSIPTLDDIIEDEIIDDTTPISVEDENDNSLDLFEEEKTDLSLDTNPTVDTPSNPLDGEDSNHKASPNFTPYTFEEAYDDSSYQLNYEIKYEDLITYDDLVDFNPIAPIQTLDVERIVKIVVKQMMPDLEQQLRFLIQQALEKQLSPEFAQSSDNETDDL